ncbi:uncharacterized protein EI90DRAFT_3257797, partial [Cantharellus anzutake]|uniref:uncharacterized protein n=1 Tax=Cantharellus anzutake TaxID=1750568 RepID=UPI0019079FC0
IQSSVRAELSRLPRAAAEHVYVTAKSVCLEGTREKMQASIVGLLGKPGSRFIWLRGSPGMGKTAICLSIASYFKNQGTLAASFFWDKN